MFSTNGTHVCTVYHISWYSTYGTLWKVHCVPCLGCLKILPCYVLHKWHTCVHCVPYFLVQHIWYTVKGTLCTMSGMGLCWTYCHTYVLHKWHTVYHISWSSNYDNLWKVHFVLYLGCFWCWTYCLSAQMVVGTQCTISIGPAHTVHCERYTVYHLLDLVFVSNILPCRISPTHTIVNIVLVVIIKLRAMIKVNYFWLI